MKWLLPRPASVLCLGALALAPTAARADQIDRVLVTDSAEIAGLVARLKPKNVAVLPFRVKIGSEQPTFRQGLEGTQLANKVQNLLVLTNPAGEPGEYVVLGEAGKKAAEAGKRQGKAFDWTTPDGRKALLELNLPCVWDTAAAFQPDTYLTGDLELTENLRGATLKLYRFTKADPALRPLCHLQEEGRVPIRVDRNMLADLGRSFAVSKGVLLKAASEPPTPVGRTRAVTVPDESAADAAGGKMAAEPVGGATAFTNCPVHLAVRYNRRPEAVVADGSGNFRLTRTPPPKTEVSFLLTNTDDQPVAVLLTVDGRNVIELNPDERAEQSSNRERWRKFVLEPKKLYEISGWRRSLDGKSDAAIQIDSEEDSAARFGSMLPAVAGKIEMLVYPAHTPLVTTVPAVTEGQPAEDPKADAPTQEQLASDLSPMETVDKAIGRTRSAAAARAFVLAKLPEGTVVADNGNGVRQVQPPFRIEAKTRGLAAEGDTKRVDGGVAKEQGFQHSPAPASRVVITYYSPEMAAPARPGGGN